MKGPKTVSRTIGVVLDSGAFIALEKGDPIMTHLVERFSREATPLVTSAGVLAEIWRGGKGDQIPIVFLLRRTRVVDLTQAAARVLGLMLGTARSRDPIDAHVVLFARERGWSVLSLFHCFGLCDVSSQVRCESIQIGFAYFGFAEKRHDGDAFAHEEPGERRSQIGSLVQDRWFRSLVFRIQGLSTGFADAFSMAVPAPILIDLFAGFQLRILRRQRLHR